MPIINQLTFTFSWTMSTNVCFWFCFLIYFFFQAGKNILLHCKQSLNLLKRFLIWAVLLVSCLKPDAIKIIELADLAGLIIFNYYYCCSHTTYNSVKLEWSEGGTQQLIISKWALIEVAVVRSFCELCVFQICHSNNIPGKSQKFNKAKKKRECGPYIGQKLSTFSLHFGSFVKAKSIVIISLLPWSFQWAGFILINISN